MSFPTFTTDRIRVNVTSALSGVSRMIEVEAWGATASPASTFGNVARAGAGGVATASSTASASFPVGAVINEDRAGIGWGSGGGWKDATSGTFPDWVQVDFSGNKAIDRVVVYSLQDTPGAPVEPTDTLTFSSFGVTDFTVEGWNGSAWVVLGTVSGNNLVKRTVMFTAFTTPRIRVNITGALGGVSRLIEVEAWGTAAP